MRNGDPYGYVEVPPFSAYPRKPFAAQTKAFPTLRVWGYGHVHDAVEYGHIHFCSERSLPGGYWHLNMEISVVKLEDGVGSDLHPQKDVCRFVPSWRDAALFCQTDARTFSYTSGDLDLILLGSRPEGSVWAVLPRL